MAEPSEPQTSTPGGRGAASEVIQSGVALVAALVAVVYPVGYSLLVARLTFSYTHSLAASWYAASLVPPANVLGQVFGIPFVLTIGVVVAFLIAEQLPQQKQRIQIRRRYGLIALAVSLAVLAVYLAVTRDISLVVGIIFGFGAGAAAGLLEGLRRRHRIGALTRWAALATMLYVVLTGISLLPSSDPLLPAVELSGPPVTSGRLLAHSDGYWYVFAPDGNLDAVPDGQAGRATIRP